MKQKIVLVQHSPYSQDAAPQDFFLFPKLKSTVRFENTDWFRFFV